MESDGEQYATALNDVAPVLRGPHLGEKGADATALLAHTRTQLTRSHGHDGTASFIRERRALERDGITGATSNKINSAVLTLCNPLRAGA